MIDNQKSPIENPRSIQRVALVIQYLGTDFHGWQRQPNQRTVQEEIEKSYQAKVKYLQDGKIMIGVNKFIMEEEKQEKNIEKVIFNQNILQKRRISEVYE